jgi:O-antigen/teichoic acid export membrane protein
MGTGRHRVVAAACVVESSANLLLSIALVGRYGLLGVAVGTMLPVVVVNLAWLMPIACRSLSMPYGRFLVDVTRPAWLPVLIMVVAERLLAMVWQTNDLAAVLAQGLLLGLLYCASLVACLPRDTRARYLRVLGRGSRAWDAGSQSRSVRSAALITDTGAPNAPRNAAVK